MFFGLHRHNIMCIVHYMHLISYGLCKGEQHVLFQLVKSKINDTVFLFCNDVSLFIYIALLVLYTGEWSTARPHCATLGYPYIFLTTCMAMSINIADNLIEFNWTEWSVLFVISCFSSTWHILLKNITAYSIDKHNTVCKTVTEDR